MMMMDSRVVSQCIDTLPMSPFMRVESNTKDIKEINALFASSPPGCMGLSSTFPPIKAHATTLEIVFNSVLVPQFQSA